MNSDHGIMPNHESVHSISSTPSRIGFGRPDDWVNGHHHHHHHGHGQRHESPKKIKKAIRPSSSLVSRVGCGRPDEWVGDHHRSSRKNAVTKSWRVKSSSTTRKENDEIIDDNTCQNSIRSAPTVMFRQQDNDIHHQLGKKKNNYHNKFNSKKIDDDEEEDDDADDDKEEDIIDFNGSIGDFVISTKKNKQYGSGIDSSVHSLLTEHSVSSTPSSRVGFGRPDEWVGSHHRSSTRKNVVRSWRMKASTTRKDNGEIMDDTTIGQHSFRSAPTVMVRRPDNDRLHHQGKEKNKNIDNEVTDDDEEEDLNDFDGSIGDFVISTMKNKKYGAGGIDSSMHSLLTEASLSSSLTTSSNHLSTAAHYPYCSTSREYTPYESDKSFVTAMKEKIYANTETTIMSPHPQLHPITNKINELQGKIKSRDIKLTSKKGENNHPRPTAMLPLQPSETSSHRHRNSTTTTATMGSSSSSIRSNHQCSIRAYNRPDAWIGGGGESSYTKKPPKRSWKIKKCVDVTKNNNSSVPDLISESLCSINDAATLSASSSIL